VQFGIFPLANNTQADQEYVISQAA
jgi:hypothetical protein